MNNFFHECELISGQLYILHTLPQVYFELAAFCLSYEHYFFSASMLENVIHKRRFFFAISGLIFLVSLFTIVFWNLNLWIDMTGGTQSEFRYESYKFDQEEIQKEAEVLSEHRNIQWNIINSISAYKITGENIFVVEAGFNRNVDEKELENHKIKFRNELETRFKELWDIELTKYTNIWASFWDYIKDTAKLTLFIAIVAIAIYIAYAFSGTAVGIPSLSFAWITLITLLHDVVISSWLYIFVSTFIPQFQIDTFFITALLTILWYSINDTIVVFDRIRANLREFGGKWKDLKEIILLSMNESFTRSVYTSLTLAFVLVCILLLWPDSISWFTLTMLFGTIIWTFSSICIASPLLYEFHRETLISEYIKQEDLSEEDKLVV